MRIRTFALIGVLALVAAACNTGGGSETSTTDPASETTTTVAADAPEAMLLSYQLEPGATFTYDVVIDQKIDMETTGDPSAMGEEEIPGEMSVEMHGTTTITQEVSEGPEDGTFTIHLTADLSDLEVTGTIDGEPVDTEEIPDFAEMESVDATIVVDEQGKIIPDDSALGEDLFGGLGGLDSMTDMGPGAGLGQFIGPALTDEEVTVGDTWSETIEVPTMPDSDPITTTVESEVVGTDEIDGNEVFVIETTTTTSAIEFDLAEMILGFMFAFVPDDASEEDKAEMEALADQLRFAFSVDETVGESTAWFDPETGYARQAEFANVTHMVMDIAMPDDETGDIVEFGLDMTIDQSVSYSLTEAGSA